jgi:DNA (cytosine-5)-methyltransferase 1
MLRFEQISSRKATTVSNLKTISLFTGAGGMDHGFEAAGFETAVGVEMDDHAIATVRANRTWPMIHRDIHQVESVEILKTAGLKVGEADLVIGGPPCQPFSKAGYWTTGDTKRLDDPRADTLFAFMRVVRDTLPKAFVLENVHGISYSGKEEGLELLEHLTETINREKGVNYSLSWRVVNATDYGVPQLRTRFFLVAHRDGFRFDFPSPTHLTPDDQTESLFASLSNPLSPSVTAWDAIGHLEHNPIEDLQMRGKWANLLPSIPEGENYLWHTSRKGGLPLFGWRTRFWSFMLKLAKNRPSWTIQAQPGPAVGPFHWDNRLLSVRELAALQTFPQDLVFKGGRVAVQKQIGNAVPSLLAEVLAREIGRQFFAVTVPQQPTLAVTYNRPIPSPALVRPVAMPFLEHMGDHADHPGTGKGPAYQKIEQPALVATD